MSVIVAGITGVLPRSDPGLVTLLAIVCIWGAGLCPASLSSLAGQPSLPPTPEGPAGNQGRWLWCLPTAACSRPPDRPSLSEDMAALPTHPWGHLDGLSAPLPLQPSPSLCSSGSTTPPPIPCPRVTSALPSLYNRTPAPFVNWPCLAGSPSSVAPGPQPCAPQGWPSQPQALPVAFTGHSCRVILSAPWGRAWHHVSQGWERRLRDR